MDNARWLRIHRLFDAALELRPTDRAAFLDEECAGDAELRAEIEELIAGHERSAGILDAHAANAIPPEALPPPATPSVIGPYRVLGKLGEGGMGVVYEAEQDHPRRRVAVKVTRSGHFIDEQSARLLQREANTLAMLKHPNIAAIYQSGRTEQGQQYFAMELVRGLSLDAYLKERPGRLSSEEVRFRLRLFVKLTAAVHYAHQKGVLHRDLKPSNIVVIDGTEGAPDSDSVTGPVTPEVKILDFGVARLLDEEVGSATLATEAGVIKGTLPYMSPEQAQGSRLDVDVRSDVYALGVILYEMLTGARPLEPSHTSLPEAVRIICEEPPRPLAEQWSDTLRLDADLATITHKALEKEIDRRYGSAATFADDVDRFLNSQPILARPPSARYQLRKLVARNKLPAALVAGTLILIVGFGVAMSLLYQRAMVAERLASEEADAAQETADFMVDLFEVSDPDQSRGTSVTAREILDQGAARLETDLADQPVIRARLLSTIGNVYAKLGLDGRALEVLEETLELRKSALGEDDPLTLRTMNDLGWSYHQRGRYDEAEPLFLRALDGQRRVLGPANEDTNLTLNNLAIQYAVLGRFDDALEMFHEVYDIALAAWGLEDPATLDAAGNLGNVYSILGRFEEAEPYYLETLEVRRRTLGGDHPKTINSLASLGSHYRDIGDYEEAELYYVESLELGRRVLGPDYPMVLALASNLANLYADRGQYERAEPLSRDAWTRKSEVMGPEHPSTLRSASGLVSILEELGRYDEAAALCLQTLEVQRRALGSEHEDTLTTINDLGTVRQRQGQLEEAEVLYLEALEGRRQLLGDEHPKTQVTAERLVSLYRDQSREEDALELEMELSGDEG